MPAGRSKTHIKSPTQVGQAANQTFQSLKVTFIGIPFSSTARVIPILYFGGGAPGQCLITTPARIIRATQDLASRSARSLPRQIRGPAWNIGYTNGEGSAFARLPSNQRPPC